MRNDGGVCELFPRFSGLVVARFIAVRTLLIVFMRPDKATAQVNAAIVSDRFEGCKESCLSLSNLQRGHSSIWENIFEFVEGGIGNMCVHFECKLS